GRSPSRHDGSHTVPDYPVLPVAFEKQFVVDKSAVHDAGNHLPVADDHADIGVLFAALRKLLHHLFRRGWMKMLDKPSARLTQPRLAPYVIEPQHQVYFFIADLRHRASPPG